MRRVLLRCFLFGAIFIASFVFAKKISASAENGTIDAIDKFAWSEKLGWINFGVSENVQVTDSELSGYVWAPEYGWINLQPVPAGVANDGAGNLSGQAWGENTGYIDFSGVSIDDEGYFHGFAEGEISGRISFNCENTDSCVDSDFKVRTDWRPQSVRNSESGGGGGGGGSGEGDGTENPNDDGGRVRDLPETENTLHPAPGHWADPYFAKLKTFYEAAKCDWPSFLADTGISRAELTRMALCSFGYEVTAEKVLRPVFPDVPGGHWAVPYIATAKAKGIVEGYGDGNFRPDQTVSRAEAIKILCYAAHLDTSAAPPKNFSDVSGGAWYLHLVHFAALRGIVQGYQDGTFRPEQAVTWAEAAKVTVKVREESSFLAQ